MPTFEIVEARQYHCGAMARALRMEHRKAVAVTGFNAHYELAARFRDSAFRRVWLIDGQLAALGGVTGGLMEPSGQVWLALSHRALRYPVHLVREARRQLAEIMTIKHEIFTLALGTDEAALRFALFLGFLPIGSPLRSSDTRAGRRMLLRFMDTPDQRMVVGDGFGVALRYRREAA